MPGYLATLPPAQQIEAAYIAYFDRAADPEGYLYRAQQYYIGLEPRSGSRVMSQVR